MDAISEQDVSCPYCGKTNVVLFDCTVTPQEYIEDCQTCCRPIIFKIRLSANDELLVSVYSEND